MAQWFGPVVLAMLLTALFAEPALAQGGALDPSFNHNGIVTVAQGQNIAGGGVVVAPDGGVVVEGQEQETSGQVVLTVTRLLPTGQPDPCFGKTTCTGSGTVIVSPGLSYSGAALAIQRDGKILAAGGIRPTPPEAYGLGVVRLNANGLLDGSFGSGGIATINPCPKLAGTDTGQASAASVTEASDGSVVMVGTASCGGFTGDQMAVVKLTPAGQPAPGFGQGGVVLSSGQIQGWDGAVEIGGKIVAVGQATCVGYCYFVEQLNADGTPDKTFGPNGNGTLEFQVASSQMSISYNVAVLGSGSIVVSGACDLTTLTASQWYVCAVRLTRSGVIDRTFGVNGTLLMADGNRGSQTMAVQTNGSLVFGSVGPTVARATADGRPDVTFGKNGVATFSVPGYKGAINGVGVDDSRGRIYAAGAASASNNYVILVAALSES
jgi:uncharacterized delta-60 repeat protein